jgi:hypothetical protein
VTVEPKLGETSGSVFRRLMLGPGMKRTIRYQSDLREAELYRNGERVAPIRGGTTPVKQFINDEWVDLKDVANYGYYVFPAEVFAPDSTGTPPVITLKLIDLKNPATPSCKTIGRSALAVTWNDFAAYYGDLGLPFTPMSTELKPPKGIADPQGCGGAPDKPIRPYPRQ